MAKGNSLSKYASLSLILGPFIEPYAISDGGTALYKVFMLLNILLFWFKGNRSMYITKKYKDFLFYALTLPTATAVLIGYTTGIVGSYITLILFTINLILVVPIAKIEYVRKYFRYAVIICIAVFFAQEISFLTTGTRFLVLIPFLHPIYAGVDMASFVAKMSAEGRSCSLFMEPSHFAHFLLAYLALALGDLHDSKKIFNRDVVIISVVLLFLRSGNGLLVLAILWTVAILFSNVRKVWKYGLVIPFSIFVAIYGFSFFSGTELGQSVLERTQELDTDITEVNSGFVRVWRGYYVYDDQPSVVKVLGVGYGGTADAVHNSSCQWMFKTKDDVYMNNIQAFLISYGLIGCVLFLLFLFTIGTKNRFGSVMLIVAFIALCFLDSFFCSSKMLLFLAIPSILSYENKTHENTLYSNR